MTLIDANVLIYAYNAEAPQHQVAATWLENLIRGTEAIGLAWITLWAFLRISTNQRLWPRPAASEQSFRVIRELLDQPGVVIVDPGVRHHELLEKLVREYGAAGPRVSDAALAALALEHGATLASSDRDFARFTGLRWINPLQ